MTKLWRISHLRCANSLSCTLVTWKRTRTSTKTYEWWLKSVTDFRHWNGNWNNEFCTDEITVIEVWNNHPDLAHDLEINLHVIFKSAFGLFNKKVENSVKNYMFELVIPFMPHKTGAGRFWSPSNCCKKKSALKIWSAMGPLGHVTF